MPNLNKRSYQSELIDDLSLSNDDLRQNLEELATINKWLGGNEVTTRALNRLLAPQLHNTLTSPDKQLSNNKLRIADIGCGGGDMLKLMSNWANKRGIACDFIGIDANPFMITFANKRTQNYSNIHYIQEDAFSDSLKTLTLDVATMTLFCHHFTEAQLIELFSNLRKNCKIGLVINDLHRHWFAYYSIAWLTALFSKSYLVKNDAKLSVWRGFYKAELSDILTKAGFQKFTVHWRWAFRWEIAAWC